MSATMPNEYQYSLSRSGEERLVKDDNQEGSWMWRHKRCFKRLVIFLVASLAVVKNLNSYSKLADSIVEFKVLNSYDSRGLNTVEVTTVEETALTEESQSDEQPQFPQVQVDSNSKVIFYHIYVPVENPENALRIVEEQLQQMKDKHVTLFYNTVGDPTALSTTQMDQWCAQYGFIACHHLQHLEVAQEEATLQPLHDFCASHPSLRVGYTHNKGSFHASLQNENWRYLMTEALVRDECWEMDDSKCNACGLFFTTDIGLYFAGNMWTVDCSYVKQLIPPSEFEARSRIVLGDALLRKGVFQLEMNERSLRHVWYSGIGRYANEWWVASHPSLRPCDFSPSMQDGRFLPTAGFIKWINNLGTEWKASNSTVLTAFQPQAPGKKYAVKFPKELNIKREYYQLPGKIHKWVEMYQQLPDQDSWVWSHFPEGDYWKQQVQKHGLNVLDKVHPIHPRILKDLLHIRNRVGKV